MRRLINKLLGIQNAEDFLDKASDNWEEIPASKVNTDWGQWLQEEPAAPRARRNSVRDRTIPNLLLLSKNDEPEEQQSDHMQPAVTSPTPAQPVKTTPLAPPAPRARVDSLPPQDRRWRDFLSAYAEHLTDEELKEIRKQMT